MVQHTSTVQELIWDYGRVFSTAEGRRRKRKDTLELSRQDVRVREKCMTMCKQEDVNAPCKMQIRLIDILTLSFQGLVASARAEIEFLHPELEIC